jgi:5-methylcytosine-specific restriction protein A
MLADEAKREAETLSKQSLRRRHSAAVKIAEAKLCTWCLQPVGGRRQCWCSDECVEAWRVIHDWTAMRYRVENRDGGICRNCKRDTFKARLLYQHVLRHAWHLYDGRRWHPGFFPGAPLGGERVARWRAFAQTLKVAYGLAESQHPDRNWWEADHIHERVRGGKNNLENLRTLCLRCHKAETKRLARERADERRSRVPLESVMS